MTATKASLVHPSYKTKYRVTNWREHETGLRGVSSVAGCACEIPTPEE